MPFHTAANGMHGLEVHRLRAQQTADTTRSEPQKRKRVGRGLLALCAALLIGPCGSWTFTGLNVTRAGSSVAIAAVEQPQVRQRQRGFSKPVKQAETPLPDHKLRAVEKKPLDWNKIDVKAPKPTVSKPTPTRSFSSSPGYSRGPTPGASRALDSVTADFFLLPRGLLEDHQIWNCQGSEWTREEGDPFCYSGGKEWRFVSRVLKGRVLALNIAKEETQPYYQEDCHMMKESDLTEEEYARYVSALIEEESKTSIRPAKQKRIKGKMMELQSKFRFRGVELHGQPYIGPVLATELFRRSSQRRGARCKRVCWSQSSTSWTSDILVLRSSRLRVGRSRCVDGRKKG